MKHAQATYTLSYDPLDQQVNFEGVFRPDNGEKNAEVFNYLVNVHNQVKGTLRLNFRRLRYINAMGLQTISRFVMYARQQNDLKLKVIASNVLPWSERVLPNLSHLWDGVEFSVYDRHFYKSQSLMEDAAFIPLLRNQTRLLWPVEKEVLPRHGLRMGMKVADICCGCGDVPLLICREFRPAFMIGIDHSEAAIEYARELQNEFRVFNASFQRGDATALMLEDNSFDFVTCRLSLQIFSQPELILQELIRITKPGGRIYALCEDYDLIVGHPENEVIRATYERAAHYGAEMGMDLRCGKKLYEMFTRYRLEDIRTDHIMVTTSNARREAFADVIESWREFSVYAIGDSLGLSQKERDVLLAGYNAQLRAIRSPYGYTTWGLVAVSGRKATE